LVSRSEHGLRVVESRVLKKIFFRYKRDDVTREWRRLHTEKLYDLYYSQNVILVIASRTISWSGMRHVWVKVEVHTEFGKETERKRSLERPRSRWKYIQLDVRLEVGHDLGWNG
jgi:hypothetical protein